MVELRAYMRGRFHIYLRPLLIEDECENCGATDNLVVHHEEQFAKMLKNSLDRLGLEFKTMTENYTEKELEDITDMLLGEHLRNKHTTLCEECHDEVHRNGMLKDRYLSERPIKKKKEKKEEIEFDVIDGCYIGVKMTKEIKDELRDKYNLKSHKRLFEKLEQAGYSIYRSREGSILLDKDDSIENHLANILTKRNKPLNTYLKKLIGVRIIGKKKEQLIRRINAKKKDGSVESKISKINEYLKNKKIDYEVISKTSGGVRYWLVKYIEK